MCDLFMSSRRSSSSTNRLITPSSRSTINNIRRSLTNLSHDGSTKNDLTRNSIQPTKHRVDKLAVMNQTASLLATSFRCEKSQDFVDEITFLKRENLRLATENSLIEGQCQKLQSLLDRTLSGSSSSNLYYLTEFSGDRRKVESGIRALHQRIFQLECQLQTAENNYKRSINNTKHCRAEELRVRLETACRQVSQLQTKLTHAQLTDCSCQGQTRNGRGGDEDSRQTKKQGPIRRQSGGSQEQDRRRELLEQARSLSQLVERLEGDKARLKAANRSLRQRLRQAVDLQLGRLKSSSSSFLCDSKTTNTALSRNTLYIDSIDDLYNIPQFQPLDLRAATSNSLPHPGRRLEQNHRSTVDDRLHHESSKLRQATNSKPIPSSSGHSPDPISSNAVTISGGCIPLPLVRTTDLRNSIRAVRKGPTRRISFGKKSLSPLVAASTVSPTSIPDDNTLTSTNSYHKSPNVKPDDEDDDTLHTADVSRAERLSTLEHHSQSVVNNHDRSDLISSSGCQNDSDDLPVVDPLDLNTDEDVDDDGESDASPATIIRDRRFDDNQSSSEDDARVPAQQSSGLVVRQAQVYSSSNNKDDNSDDDTFESD